MRGRRQARTIAYLVLAPMLLALLVMHARDGWRYINDDNGARYSAYARTHLRVGLTRTRGQDYFYDVHSDVLVPYGHHPTGLALLLAGWFRLAGDDSPVVARAVPVAFHLVSAWLLFGLLFESYRAWPAVLGAFAFAVVPMSSYFGKMVNFEPIVLPFVIGLVTTYWRWAEERPTGSLGMLLVLGAIGLLIDWPILLGLAVVSVDAARRWWRGEGTRFLRAALQVAATGLAGFAAMAAFLLGGPGGRAELAMMAARRMGAAPCTLDQWLRRVVMVNQQFFTRPVQQVSLLALALLVYRRWRTGTLAPRDRLLLLFGAVGLLNVVIFPNGAFFHAYWQFYLLPFEVLSLASVLEVLDGHLAGPLKPVAYGALGCYCASEVARRLAVLYAAPSAFVASRLLRWKGYL